MLFGAELWERFSYYGMRALLVLYLIARSGPEADAGFGWEESSAYLLYGLYTWAVYLTPILGGFLADRFLGTHRSLLIGGVVIAAGHLTLAATEAFALPPGEPVTLTTAPGALACFVTGLALVVVGTGFFKPCSAVMVGQLYAPGDPRRDAGFTLYYLGINLGAVLAPLVAGTLGERLGWAWGFGAAAVGMLLGLALYVALRPRHLAGVGLAPDRPERAPQATPEPRLDAVARDRIAVILVLTFVGNIVFWAAFEQAGSSLNVFAARDTDRTLGGFLGEPFPATWYQSANPASVLLFAPFFAVLWPALAARGREPSTPVKFALGLWLLGLAFLAMVPAAAEARGDDLAGAHWLLITYVVVTWGELCLSPVGLSAVTKLAPAHLQSLMMGVYYFTFSLANLLAGFLATFSVRFADGTWTFLLPGLPGFFLLLAAVPAATGTLLWLLAPVLRRRAHGIH